MKRERVSCDAAPALLVVLLALVACSATPANDDDPVAKAVEFIELARAGKCRDAFIAYTAASQQNLRERSQKAMENSSYHTAADEPHHLHCRGLIQYLPNSVTPTGRSADGDTAYLSAILRTGSRRPIPFVSEPLRERPVTLSMAREDGAWKMVAPFISIEDPHRHELKVGRFHVDWARRPPTDVRGFRTSGMLSATPEDIQAVMLDFEGWPGWMPHVEEARALTEPDDAARPRRELVYVRHAAAADAPGVDFVVEFTNNARAGEGGHRAFTGGWHAVPHAGASPADAERGTVWGVSFSARSDSNDATRMTFDYAAQPAEWPQELQPIVFRPQYGPALLAALEQEALRRSR